MRKIITIIILLLQTALLYSYDFYPLTDSGLTICFDNYKKIPCPSKGEDFYGQDANYQGIEQKFEVKNINGDEVVKDLNTGLIWQKSDDGIKKTWQEAKNYCEELNLGGFNDWRLPSHFELSTLVNYGTFNPAINKTVFKCQSDYYWTATKDASEDDLIWCINFFDGEIYGDLRDDSYSKNYVRCVRGKFSNNSFLCSTNHPENCKTEDDCENAGGYWYNDKCNVSPQINSQISLKPFCSNVLPGEEVKIKVEGTKGDYIISSTGGYIELDEGVTDIVNFTGDKKDKFYIWVSEGDEISYACVNTEIGGGIVSLSPGISNVNLREGETYRLSLRAYRKDGSWIEVTDPDSYSNSNENVVKYEDGILYGISSGNATIEFEYKGLKTKVEIKVKKASRSIIVKPSKIIIEKGSEGYISIFLMNSGGNIEDITDRAELSIKDSNIAEINDGRNKILGKEVGITLLEVKYDGMSVTAPITVVPVRELGVMPSEITVEQGKEVTITPYGGSPPYKLIAEQGSIIKSGTDKYKYKASNVVGNDTITIIDNSGSKVTCSVNIVAPLEVSPSEATLMSGGSIKLIATGGDGNYKWFVTEGKLSSNTGTEVNYEAPGKIGRYVVTVMDGSGNIADVKILVGKRLVLSPGEIYLSPEEKADISILGGISPYTITVDAGSYSLKGDSAITYTAPKVSGIYSIKVKDSSGQEATTNVKVRLPLMVTPESIITTPGKEIKLSALGGIGDIIWEAERGSLSSLKGNEVQWKAPSILGSLHITAHDSSDSISVISVDVVSKNIKIVPSNIHVLPGESVKFEVVKGTGSYTWQVEAGDIKTEGANNEKADFTAPNITGTYKVNVSDSAGNTATATVYVYREKLRVTPKNLYVSKGEEGKIGIYGGTGEYTMWTGVGSLDNVSLKDKRYIKYIPPKNYEGTDTIFIIDSAGNKAVCHVEIVGKNDIISMYSGKDNKIDDSEMQEAITDFIKGDKWLTPENMYNLIEKYLNDMK